MPRTLTNQAALAASQMSGALVEMEAVYDFTVATPTLQETGGVLTSDGTEQVVYIRNAPVSVFDPRVVMISLDDMVALDVTTIRVYYRLAAGGGLLLYDYEQYTGADGGLINGRKMIAVQLMPCRFGVEVSLQQTVGAADYPWSVVEEA